MDVYCNVWRDLLYPLLYFFVQLSKLNSFVLSFCPYTHITCGLLPAITCKVRDLSHFIPILAGARGGAES